MQNALSSPRLQYYAYFYLGETSIQLRETCLFLVSIDRLACIYHSSALFAAETESFRDSGENIS